LKYLLNIIVEIHKNQISRACHTWGGLVGKLEEKDNLESLSIDGSRSM